MSTPAPWWTDAVVYQVYIRSFADGSGDGIGDIAGLRSRLGHLASLGVDALWINPWFASPQADAGYDVADYRAIEPAYGSLEEADALVREAHALGLRVLLDLVPNHTSSEHAWFRAALAGDEAARGRYLFRPGRGASGELPPNDWASIFGGPAWTRSVGADGEPGDWYLHMFAPGQPDLDWENPEVRAEFEDVLRFWFDRDVDGFRIDVAQGMVKAPGLPDVGPHDATAQHNALHPAWDNDGVHEVYRSWRAIADSYDPPRIFVAEAWVRSNERLALYLRPDELHTAFQFDFLSAPFEAGTMRAVVDEARAAAREAGGTCTWVLSNHDVVRHVTRYARSQPAGRVEAGWERARWASEAPELELGTARARAAFLLTAALPGSVYVYQGEELGLPEVEDLPDEARQDPMWFQGSGEDPGRDGCRVPLPWSASPSGSFGFSPADAAGEPWLPQPADWGSRSVESQEDDPSSTLHLYRSALRLRRQTFTGELVWVEAPEGVLAFARGGTEVWMNTGDCPVELPSGRVLLRSDAGEEADEAAKLPPNATAWLVRA